MASTLLHLLSHVNTFHLTPSSPNTSLSLPIHSSHKRILTVKSTTNSSQPLDDQNTTSSFPIEKRRNAEIIRDRKSKTGLAKPEPPNLEIGWKRTKEIRIEKPKGYVIADFMEKLEVLMGKEFGSKELLAKAGEIVSDRAREEAEMLRDGGEVEDRLITELFRVLKLMEMDLAMVKAAVKEETLK